MASSSSRAEYKVQLAGGDTAQSPDGILADIIVVGSVPSGKAILRSGARLGDIIYVTGTLGGSVATLEALAQRQEAQAQPASPPLLSRTASRRRQVSPRKKLATALIDISDGLSTDLRHLCDESRVGATLESTALPHTEADTTLRYALHGGEDYELLFTAPANKRVPNTIAGVPITRIGAITPGRQIKLKAPDGKSPPSPRRRLAALRLINPSLPCPPPDTPSSAPLTLNHVFSMHHIGAQVAPSLWGYPCALFFATFATAFADFAAVPA